MGTTQKQVKPRGNRSPSVAKTKAKITPEAPQQEPAALNEQDEKKTESPEELLNHIMFYEHVKLCSEQRKARVEDLMKRRSANGWRNLRGQRDPGWDASKKTKMVRRLMRATQELEQATEALEQLRHRFSQLVPEIKRANNVAPFVPVPATSV